MNEVANFIPGQYLADGSEGCEVNKWNNPAFVPSKYTVSKFASVGP